MDDLASRTTRDVFDDHLDLAQQGRFDEDITRNFSEDCVILTNRGAFRGHEGLRQLAGMLQREIPDAEYGYINRLVEGRFALLEWTADCGAVAVQDGADTFVVENGKVVAQTRRSPTAQYPRLLIQRNRDGESPMTTLYTMPGTCSLSPNIAVAWLDAPVEIHNIAYGDQKKDDFLAINSKGKVPALRFDDGDVLTEASAILAWLGAAHGKEGYARDSRLGRKEAEALSYMTSEVHATYGGHFNPKNFAQRAAAQDEVKRKTYENLAGHYERMNGVLRDNGGEWYLGQRSFADTFLYVLTRWLEQTPLSIEDYPALKEHRARIEADEGVRLALKRQDMEPVG